MRVRPTDKIACVTTLNLKQGSSILCTFGIAVLNRTLTHRYWKCIEGNSRVSNLAVSLNELQTNEENGAIS